MTIRKAQLSDVPVLFDMINHYAAEKVMLPRTLADLYENVWEFTVAEEDGRVLGCGALKLYSAQLAEVRSLCVAPGLSRRGVGRQVLESVLEEAEAMHLKTVFALTLTPEFFAKFGFREVPRESLFMKVWRDCLRCERHSRCQEKAFVLDLSARRERKAEAAAEPAEMLSD